MTKSACPYQIAYLHRVIRAYVVHIRVKIPFHLELFHVNSIIRKGIFKAYANSKDPDEIVILHNLIRLSAISTLSNDSISGQRRA